ncbi:MAG: DUF4968 domain-containing protein, partial [Prevotella sp.]|nr:DUF4968 domain-containing protein [Prevotella sp.]
MKKSLLIILLSSVAVFASAADDLRFNVADGRLSVSFITADIVRVQYSPDGQFKDNETGVCVWQKGADVPLQITEGAGYKSIVSDSLEVRVSRAGVVSFYDRSGRLLLTEDTDCPHRAEHRWIENVVYQEGSGEVKHTANGDVQQMNVLRRDTIGATWRCYLNFKWQDGEALYGLGSHMEDYLNLRGKRLYLCQHNLKAMVPV